MKKIKLVFTIGLLSLSAFADINMMCVTEMPTTSLVVATEGNTIKFRVVHHNGLKYMPIHQGVITPNDLEILSKRADKLAILGDDYEFSLDKKDCQQIDGILINCFGKSEIKNIDGHNIYLWSVYTSRLAEESFAGNFNYVNTSVALDIDGEVLHVPMKYSEGECFETMNKNEKKR